MHRVAPFNTPAFWPALLFLITLLLQGCSLLPNQKQDEPASVSSPVAGADKDDAGKSQKEPHDAFSIEVEAPDKVREYLVRHLELQRYRQIDDLGAAELSRLMVAAEANARELLGTLGYFTPTLTLELRETPDAPAPRQVHVTVAPGEPTLVAQVEINFSGAVAEDAAGEAQRNAVRAGWSLRPSLPFSQEAWDNAKSGGLRTLTAKRYPTASVKSSRADVDADTARAQLHVAYESGPAYRFGPMLVRGSDRYNPINALRIARLPQGQDYDQQVLLDAQQRLASSGYYDSVFLTLDTEGKDPQAVPVIAQVRDAPLQKVVLGVGFTTDNGARVSIDHTNNQMPVLGWRAVSRLQFDQNTQFVSTQWTDVPGERGWRWFGGGQLKRDTSGDYEVDSARVRGGMSTSTDHIDRSYFLQYDNAQNKGVGAPPSASALTLNWGWTGRYFNNPAQPTSGYGVAVELGAGYTLTGERLPFLRSYGRWLGIFPLDWTSDSAARRSRIALRAEAGAVTASDRALIPTTLEFLTGGDNTVRGYSYQEIGVPNALGQTVQGRYLGVGSVEWQRPYIHSGQLTDWESVVFVDAGSVADQFRQLRAKFGVGAGARWKSPVGPVQIDLAYGVDIHKFRLHLRLGFNF
ncbi:BamA/TamA family outer membrane protein [Variovorax sp. dw_954]|uniref:autotransporter assembly complex protein TamA n=1 Tax=Variovorax sp. dw_954 TaxID=2720078 RepID=UPI001BD22088|nr:BamA/TamA family outer membrane protein [Variovorax sp. dw_954]